MGNIVGYVKLSCNRCNKYGIQTLSSLYPFGLILKEKNCPFCQSEIEESIPSQLEIDTFIKDSIKNTLSGAAKMPTLKDVLIYQVTG